MGDAGRARRDREDAGQTCLCRCHSHGFRRLFSRRFRGGLRLFRELRRLGLVEDLEELFPGLRRQQLFAQIQIHQQGHQTREHLEVQVAVHRRRDHEDQVGGLAVRCTVIDAAGNGHRRQAGIADSVALAVRDGNAFADRCRPLALALQDPLGIYFFVGQIAGFVVLVDQSGDRLFLGLDIRMDDDRGRFEQILDLHSDILLSISSLVASPGEQAVAEPAAVPRCMAY